VLAFILPQIHLEGDGPSYYPSVTCWRVAPLRGKRQAAWPISDIAGSGCKEDTLPQIVPK